jgi:group I intron endonuclease
MKKCGIYGIKNLANGKWYIGQSVDIDIRQENHFRCLTGGYHFNAHLQRAFDKYGINNFTFHVLEVTSESMLDIRERAWIAYYSSADPAFGYNRETGGRILKRHSALSRFKMSLALTGKKRKPFTPEARRNMSLAQKAIPRSSGQLMGLKKAQAVNRCTPKSEMHRRHLSEAKRGKISLRQLEALRKISESNKGRHHSISTLKKMSTARSRFWALHKF